MASAGPGPRRPAGALGRRWSAPGGYADFLRLAFPLVLSTASWSVQHFVDRVFLTWYDTDALAAALPAGMVSFVVVSLFMGAAGYVNTFVAQYVGAGRPRRVGPALWHGGYVALLSAGAGFALALAARSVFDLIGHEAAVRTHEVAYFRVLCYGIGPVVLTTALSCFYSGRGRTLTVLAVSLSGTLSNIVLDYGLIFGHWGLPELGIRGAAWATNAASLFTAATYLVLLARPAHRRTFATYSGWSFDRDLARRLLRYGGPNGVNFMLDMLTFTLFVLIVGRIGTLELTATNLAFNINSLAFMPLIGAGIALSTMVGQRLGQDDPAGAEYCTWTGVQLAVGYMAVMSAAYLFLPDLFLLPYGAGDGGPDFVAVRALARSLLRIVGLYCVFDAAYMMFSAALKGAGDTRYLLVTSVLLGWSIQILPPLVAVAWFDAGVYTVWAFLVAYLAAGAFVFYRRFRAGQWKDMRVIERPLAVAVEETEGMVQTRAGL